MTIDIISELDIPEDSLGPDRAKKYLSDFVDWTENLLLYLVDATGDSNEDCSVVFEQSQIRYLKEALFENKNQFRDLKENIHNASDESIVEHGLEKVQLILKLSNVNFWFIKTKKTPRNAMLWERLFSSILALLRSLLGAAGFGTSIEELIEAVKNSIALINKDKSTPAGKNEGSFINVILNLLRFVKKT